MNREERVQVFKETMKLCEENERLNKSIKNSVINQGIIWEEDLLEEPVVPGNIQPRILISQKRTMEAVEQYSRTGKKVCALNFASYIQPGGGVVKGSSAQEESICRISTLYPAISDISVQDFYQKHLEMIRKDKEKGKIEGLRKNRDDCIYTPGVVVLRKDTKECELMPEEEWYETALCLKATGTR